MTPTDNRCLSVVYTRQRMSSVQEEVDVNNRTSPDRSPIGPLQWHVVLIWYIYQKSTDKQCFISYIDHLFLTLYIAELLTERFYFIIIYATRRG